CGDECYRTMFELFPRVTNHSQTSEAFTNDADIHQKARHSDFGIFVEGVIASEHGECANAVTLRLVQIAPQSSGPGKVLYPLFNDVIINGIGAKMINQLSKRNRAGGAVLCALVFLMFQMMATSCSKQTPAATGPPPPQQVEVANV